MSIDETPVATVVTQAEEAPGVPFLRWPGGKRWLISDHAEVFEGEYRRYIEPFLGAGSVFFALQPAISLLGDSNVDLIGAYLALKSDPAAVEQLLAAHHELHTPAHYYEVRARTPVGDLEVAARFIYLNRTCFNGIYRVNRAGKFNVPVGSRTTVLRPDDDFGAVSRALQSATITHGDFETLVDQAEGGDLLFADPPYTVQHNQNGFIKYNEKLFTWSDQIRLAAALSRAASRGAHVVSTNAAHESIRQLYRTAGFRTQTLARFSPVSAAKTSRKSFEELLIVNARS